MDTSKTVSFMVFHSNAQANIIKGLLESNGIECFLSNENAPFSSPMFNTDLGLIRLHVMEKDVQQARMILTGHVEDMPDR
ncbi:MAG: DUF2007 domain-containing protein [Prevotellaceae bacterium]|jgi:hypothetical protein|nr:DUF2007 domain-containing protein [Prevotellaceae bacterium]